MKHFLSSMVVVGLLFSAGCNSTPSAVEPDAESAAQVAEAFLKAASEERFEEASKFVVPGERVTFMALAQKQGFTGPKLPTPLVVEIELGPDGQSATSHVKDVSARGSMVKLDSRWYMTVEK